MAEYWNKSASGYNNSTYCYGYYQGQWYGSGGYSVSSTPGGSSWGTVYNAYVVSGNRMDWGALINGYVYLKIGNSSDGYGWYNVGSKKVYTTYYNPDDDTFEEEYYVSFSKTGSSVTTTIKNYSDIGLIPPEGKSFKEWNTASDGSGTVYLPGDTFTSYAGNINGRYQWVKLYAIWEDGGAGYIDNQLATCYICIGQNDDGSSIWKQASPYIYDGTAWKPSTVNSS